MSCTSYTNFISDLSWKGFSIDHKESSNNHFSEGSYLYLNMYFTLIVFLSQFIFLACGGFLKADEGAIKYPPANVSNYRNRVSCAFTIAANVTSKVLNITFKKFDIEESPECRNDWLEVSFPIYSH